MQIIKWYLKSPNGNKHERSFLFEKAIFKKDHIYFECKGYTTTRSYDFLNKHNAIINNIK